MFSPDMLYLRSFMIGASASGILYNLLQPTPLIAPALWGCFFICGHSVQITRILLADEDVSMSTRDHELYEMAFLKYGFTPRVFARLMEEADATWVSFPDNTIIASQGSEVKRVQIILSGGAIFTHAVKHKKTSEVTNRVARVIDGDSVEDHRGTWVGEAWDPDFLKHRTQSHTITTVGDTSAVSFDIDKFHSIIDNDPSALACAERMQLDDLSGKLEAYERAHEKEVHCMEQKMTALKEQVDRLEGKQQKGRGLLAGWSLHTANESK
jgi:hypothetical protein